ncbi:splicing factor ESS-2 homolog [Ornithodoros turicata]|uniref:splicing factor ESS-2 homolog n=1 Tax=Ornithodoros turicata TaxID=34597 RepID=UPI003138ED9B
MSCESKLVKLPPSTSLVACQTSKPVRQQKILDEDTYTEEVAEIIERDFFPDVPKLKAQNEYLDALEANDIIKLRNLQQKYGGSSSGQRSHLSTPSTFETPINHVPSTPARTPSASQAQGVEGNSEKSKKKLSLDAFLARHTSEDNASFSSILQEAQQRHRDKYGWMYKDEAQESAPLARLLSSQEPTTASSAPVTWNYTNRNSLMYIPDGVKEEKGPGRIVESANTRLEAAPFDEGANQEAIAKAASMQAKAQEGRVGVDGKQKQPSPVHGTEYGFVATPSPAPGVGESPLMTWGEVEGTPFLLDGTPRRTPGGPQFKIPEPPSRERLALSLADDAARKNRAKRSAALRHVRSSLLSPSLSLSSPASPLGRLNSMSPAARNLASAKLGITKGVDRALRQSYTPSPRSTRDSDDLQFLTDNLLNLPQKRKAAADFF